MVVSRLKRSYYVFCRARSLNLEQLDPKLVFSIDDIIVVVVLFLYSGMTCLDAGTTCIVLVVHSNRLLWYDPGSCIDPSLCTTSVCACALLFSILHTYLIYIHTYIYIYIYMDF